MNQLTPYAAFFMRLAVGGVFLHHGLMKYHTGIAGVAGFLHSVGVPFATIGAVILIVVETIGALCVLLGIFTRIRAVGMAIEVLVSILAVQVPRGGRLYLERLLVAAATALLALDAGSLTL